MLRKFLLNKLKTYFFFISGETKTTYLSWLIIWDVSRFISTGDTVQKPKTAIKVFFWPSELASARNYSTQLKSDP